MEVTVSVVIPVRRARATIDSTLAAAAAQARDAGGEVIAAVWRGDPSYEMVRSAAAREKDIVRMVVADQRCGVPQLRRDAVLAARAPYVVITEDHCVFPPGWLTGLLNAPGDVRGGAVGNGKRDYAGWAQYFTRYSAFLPTAARGFTGHLPGNNACYPRQLLEGDAIADGFWEAELNAELIRRGARFFMDPALTVEQRQHRGWLEFAGLRFQHGRCYGGRSGSRKIRFVARIPLIPLILIWRNVRAVARKRYHPAWFLLSFPLLLCYIAAWSAGEAAGYLWGPGQSCRNTD